MTRGYRQLRGGRLSDPLGLPGPVARMVTDPPRVRACGHRLADGSVFACAAHPHGGLRCAGCHERHVARRHGGDVLSVLARTTLSGVPTVDRFGEVGLIHFADFRVVGVTVNP